MPKKKDKTKEPTASERLDGVKIICTKCLKLIDTSKRLDLTLGTKLPQKIWVIAECHGDKRLLYLDSEDLSKSELFWSNFSESDYIKVDSNSYGYDNTLKNYSKALKTET